ncbi:hypothetical protein [Chenggangzhangella methanolivorans]|uniref:Uncharacterized protein n=1 Tax=Chenggangzhangella methanolivorans TaxID=1437009 RepID=A0A9E6RFS4_9HYPH|nr:hypothetical protein [Chenggangzhangella methanolivorans]QZO00531.1 hypothetical protein K6K41_02020 [Chenggangzhangella methanolivorans]
MKLSFNLRSLLAERGGKQELRDWLASDAQYWRLLPPGAFLAPGNCVIYLLPL